MLADDRVNGTYNDEQIARDVALRNGDRIKVGSTIFKFLSGADVEAVPRGYRSRSSMASRRCTTSDTSTKR